MDVVITRYMYVHFLQVYVINLARRPERRGRMSAILDELGYNYTVFDAVDGRYSSYRCFAS